MAPAAFSVRGGNTRLRAVLGLVFIGTAGGQYSFCDIIWEQVLPAVTTSMLAATWLWAVTHTVADGLAVGAFYLSTLSLSAFLFTVLCNMADFYRSVSNCLAQKWAMRVGHTITVAALDDITITRHSCICQPLNVVLGAIRPSVIENISRGVRAAVECHRVFHIQIALEVNQSVHISNFLVLYLRSAVSGFLAKSL